MKRSVFAVATMTLVAFGVAACGNNGDNDGVPDASTPQHSSTAYKGHLGDQDIDNFVTAYPQALGTRLDDCQTCHAAGTLDKPKPGGGSPSKVTVNACNFCHLVQHPDPSLEGQPTTYADTLNPYGAAYNQAGRSVEALRSIDGVDSDGDGVPNGVEITGWKYPGDPNSKPNQPDAPRKVLTLDDLKAMPNHTQFLLANSNKQQFDTYATYTGVTIKDLLEAVGVDTTDPELQGVTVIAPDGFMQSQPLSTIVEQYPTPRFYGGLDTATLGATCGFVEYPSPLPTSSIDAAGNITDPQFLLLAWEREGEPMDPTTLDPTSGKINGEGPYRLVVPQAEPSAPDRGSQYSPTTCGDSYDYDSSKDHNAGSMVRGVIAVRVDPLPKGFEDFDTKYGGWSFITNSTIVVYGHGIK